MMLIARKNMRISSGHLRQFRVILLAIIFAILAYNNLYASDVGLAEIPDDFNKNLKPLDGDDFGTSEYDIGIYEYFSGSIQNCDLDLDGDVDGYDLALLALGYGITYNLNDLQKVAQQLGYVQGEMTTVQPTEIDDILNNPGRGFTEFHGVRLPFEEHPTPTVSYYRWSWAKLEPADGEYNFELVDNTIAEAKAKGLGFAFRIMPHWKDSTPSWLIEMGLDSTTVEDGSFPDHNNLLFLQYQERLIKAFGERYDGSPDIDHIDVGSVGCWGEWNTACCGSQTETCKSYFPTEENKRRIIDWYIEAFPNTPLVMLISDVVDYAVSKGSGWRGDCFGNYRSSSWNHMDHWYGPTAEDPLVGEAWKTAPVQFEVCGVMQDWYDNGYDIDLILQKGLEWHVSVLNAKSFPVPSQWRPKVDEFIKKMGYRLVLTSLTHTTTVKPGGPIHLNSKWTNAGVAPIYHSWPLAYRLRDSNGQVVSMWISPEDLRTWLPGSHEVEDVETVPNSVVAGNYALDVAILTEDEKAAHVKLAIQGVRPDGWYPISSVQVED